MFTVFLARVSPTSSEAKPKCIMKTRIVETSIHTLLIVNKALSALAIPSIIYP